MRHLSPTPSKLHQARPRARLHLVSRLRHPGRYGKPFPGAITDSPPAVTSSAAAAPRSRQFFHRGCHWEHVRVFAEAAASLRARGNGDGSARLCPPPLPAAHGPPSLCLQISRGSTWWLSPHLTELPAFRDEKEAVVSGARHLPLSMLPTGARQGLQSPPGARRKDSVLHGRAQAPTVAEGRGGLGGALGKVSRVCPAPPQTPPCL